MSDTDDDVAERDVPGSHDFIPARYRPTKDAIETATIRSLACCGEGDRRRVADRIGRLIGARVAVGTDPHSLETFVDLVLFERNDRGVRPFDRFLSGAARSLPPFERDIAQRMAAAFFSIVRIAGAHEETGVWVEDVLDGDRRLWIGDLSLKDEDAIGLFVGARIFDAGPFHATTAPPVSVTDRMVELCRKTIAAGKPSPFKRSLAATLHGIQYLADGMPEHVSGMKFARELYDAMVRGGMPPSPAPRIPGA